MPRKSKRVLNRESLNYSARDKRNVDKNQDCVFIGKENMERWTDLKMKYNFMSDNEFASYLLDLFISEKSYFPIKAFRKAENKLPNNLTEDTIYNAIHQEVSAPKILLLKNTSLVENSSSVIVMNNTLGGGTCNEDSQYPLAPVSPICTEDNSNQQEDSTTAVNSSINKGIPDPTNKIEDVVKHQPTPDQDTLGMSVEVKYKKHKKKKANDLKHHSVAEEQKHIKHRKRRLKSSENKVNNSKTEKMNEESLSMVTMKSEESEPEPSDELESRAKPPEPCERERVAITIRLCTDCEMHHIQDACPLRKPIAVVQDAVTLSEWTCGEVKNDAVKSFAEASLPPCLELKVVDHRHGPSVVARQELQAFWQFGPLVGQSIKEMEMPDDSNMLHIWELSDRTSCHYMTTSDPNTANWLRYVRPAVVRSSRNLEVILRDDQLLFVTTTSINAGEELFFWAENTNTAWSHKKLCKTKCGGCNLNFSHTLYYRLHCAVFHDPAYSLTVRKYHCKVCGLSVLGKENIVKHAAERHNGKGAYQCQYCHKFFLRLNYLEMHRTYGCSANPNRARPLCDYCGRKFCQPQKLKVHIKRMHSEMLEVLRDFQCKHCLKILGSRVALQRHFKEVHQKDVVGAFTCDRCGKMFQNKSNLKIHMLTHSGVKPFKCKEPECSAAFTTKQCLQFHYRKIHGLKEGCMPRIERSVEYTFDAYAGSRRPSSVNSDSQCSSDGEDTPDKYPNEETSPLSPPISVTSLSVDQPPLENFNKMVASKGSKKWMGEVVGISKTNVFDFNEDDNDQDINVSQIEEEPIPMLFHHCKQDSSNASLLVEAALNAAERDIDITSKIPSPVSLVTSKETYPVLRSHLSHSPLSLSRPASPVEYPTHDQSQSPHLAMESCYSTTMSPRHSYSLMFPERTPHYEFRLSPQPGQMDTFHLDEARYDLHHRRTEENSGDEGVNVVQNLSLGLKNKPLQLDIPYKYDTLEERSFECVEGLDMSRTSSYHHSFVSMTPRYPHTLYEPRSYSHTDVLRVVNFSHSVDLSLPRSHHQLTPPINQTLVEPIRIISPPPYQAYPLSTSPYSRPPHSPTYHHYNTTY